MASKRSASAILFQANLLFDPTIPGNDVNAEALRAQAAKEAAAEALKAEQKAARDARYAARKKKK